MQGAQVPYLVRELRSHVAWPQNKEFLKRPKHEYFLSFPNDSNEQPGLNHRSGLYSQESIAFLAMRISIRNSQIHLDMDRRHHHHLPCGTEVQLSLTPCFEHKCCLEFILHLPPTDFRSFFQSLIQTSSDCLTFPKGLF